MNIFLPTLIVFLLGAIMGSFLNVLILRDNLNKNRRKRSVCLSCGHVLSSSDLFPIISFLFLKGRCRYCHSRISIQYPLVEFLSGILFVFSFFVFFTGDWTVMFVIKLLVLFGVSLSFVFIFFYDLRHKIITDFSIIILSFLSICFLLISFLNGEKETIVFDILAGPFSSLPILFLWLISRGRWIGLGDVKLLLPIGWLLGWKLWLSSLVLSFWLGAFFVVSILIFRFFLKSIGLSKMLEKMPLFKPKTEIPFGPFIILSAIFSLFSDLNVFYLFLM